MTLLQFWMKRFQIATQLIIIFLTETWYTGDTRISPSRAGLSHSSSWRIFSSARLLTFFTSAQNQKLAERLLATLIAGYFEIDEYLQWNQNVTTDCYWFTGFVKTFSHNNLTYKNASITPQFTAPFSSQTSSLVHSLLFLAFVNKPKWPFIYYVSKGLCGC